MPTQDNPAETGPTLFMPGEKVLVEADVVTALALGCRVRVPGMTPGLSHYVCIPHRTIRKMGQDPRR